MADSLITSFHQLRGLVTQSDTGRLESYLDELQLAELRQLARKRGFFSFRSFLRHQAQGWPNLDTLSLVEIRNVHRYVRLSFQGSADWSHTRTASSIYTYLLYRQTDDGWRLAGMTDIERARVDQYGYRISVHETDLPPRLRFPRAF
ncbi:MAG: hypothetical protein ACE5FH_06915 [Candidatus Zixiibacteriota bacterium]